MSLMQDEVRIGLIGPRSAGKSSMFGTFQEALDSGRHGFPRATNPKIRRTAEATPVEGLAPEDIIEGILGQGGQPFNDDAANALSGAIAATPPDQIVTRHYSLTYDDVDEGRQRTVQLTITDAAGEHSFGKNLQNKDTEAYRRQLHRELGSCHGFVVVVPFSTAGEVNFIRQLESWLDALDKIASVQEKADPMLIPRQRRLVIALTRYDVLLTDFGSDAFNFAADPAIATDIINRLVRHGTNGDGYGNKIARFDKSAGGRFEIVFVPTSSFGFVPGFGCANLDPDLPDDDAVRGNIKLGMSPDPFKVALPGYPGQHVFPFLTADPFIYAATGMENPFVVPIDRAVRQVRYADHLMKRDHEHDRVGPVAPPARDRAGGPGTGPYPSFGRRDGKEQTVFSDAALADNDSWRRRLARFLRRLDIDL